MRLPRRLGVLTLGHFTIDTYSSFFLPVLPLLFHRLGLNYTKVGALVAIASLSSSFSQPLFGLLADRLRRPWFVAAGPVVAAVFMSAIGLAPTYWALVALLFLAGLGVAAFHPQTAALAGASLKQRGVAMSFWVTGGTLGWALGPLFATTTVGLFGIGRTWVAAIPGAAVSAVLFAWFARVPPAAHGSRPRTRLADLRPVARPLTALYFAVVARSAVSIGFATFLPLWAHARGWSVAAGGTLTTVYLLLGALGGFAGGWMADRIGGRRVVIGSFLFAAPLYALFFALPGRPALALTFLVLGYFLLQGSLPVNVVLGQELSPVHAGTISSLLMGAAWGLGQLLIGPIGALADRTSLATALLALSGFVLLGFGCALHIPAGRRVPRAVPAPAD